MTDTHKLTGPGPLCASCGQCCKKMPGMYGPSDFAEAHFAMQIESIITSGQACIDYWRGDINDPYNWEINTYYVRPRIKGYEEHAVHTGWGGECINLGPIGCLLPDAARPLECRTLTPKEVPENRCVPEIGKEGMVRKWVPHQELLRRLYAQYY